MQRDDFIIRVRDAQDALSRISEALYADLEKSCARTGADPRWYELGDISVDKDGTITATWTLTPSGRILATAREMGLEKT